MWIVLNSVLFRGAARHEATLRPASMNASATDLAGPVCSQIPRGASCSHRFAFRVLPRPPSIKDTRYRQMCREVAVSVNWGSFLWVSLNSKSLTLGTSQVSRAPHLYGQLSLSPTHVGFPDFFVRSLSCQLKQIRANIIRAVVKTMVLFWAFCTMRQLLFRGPKRGP